MRCRSLLALAIVTIGAGCSASTPAATPAPTVTRTATDEPTTTNTTEPDTECVTATKLRQVEHGMSASEVTDIFGCTADGTISSATSDKVGAEFRWWGTGCPAEESFAQPPNLGAVPSDDTRCVTVYFRADRATLIDQIGVL